MSIAMKVMQARAEINAKTGSITNPVPASAPLPPPAAPARPNLLGKK